MLRTLYLLIAFSFLSLYTQAQEVLLDIDDQQITVDEFLHYYQKNRVNQVTGKITPVEDYLQMFIDFKLKVAEAKRQKLDTLSAFKEELRHYTKQLSRPYLVDQQEVERLVREAYERKQQEVHASHILVRIPEFAYPKDTLYAYQKIQRIRRRLNYDPFAQVAKGTSEDPSVKRNAGDLGYFTALQMVYPFETAAYSLKPGEISGPIRTAYGYHLIKSHDKRKNEGKIKVAHIMLLTPGSLSAAAQQQKKQQIDELYHKLMGGADFTELAENYSEDKGTARTGGVLPWFKKGDMVASFEKAAFELSTDGAISKPVKTTYGWHIIKRLEREQVGSFDEEKEAIEQQVLRSKRIQSAVDSLVKNLLRKHHSFSYPNRLNYFYTPAASGVTLTDTVLVYKDQPYYLSDLQQYMHQTLPHDSLMGNPILVKKSFNDFVHEKVLASRKAELTELYPEYRYLLREYHDGLLLFELMDQRVWGKSNEDTSALRNYYQEHKEDYMWPERFRGRVYECATAKVCEQVKKARRGGLFRKGLSDEQLLSRFNEDEKMLTISSNVFSEGENGYIDAYVWGDKQLPGYVFVKGQTIQPSPKPFKLVKGQVMADYQEALEKKLKAELRNKFKIEIHEQNWQKTKAKFH
jgi:peptidyl-prolyl cis-trans isomerase SurA